MTIGVKTSSNLFTKQHATLGHLMTHGMAAEVADVRKDIAAVLGALAGIAVDEYTDMVATAVNAIKTTIATSTSIASYTGAGLNGAVGAAAIVGGRNVSVTAAANVGGYTGNATFTGLDMKGAVQTEAVAITASSTVLGVKVFKSITSISLPAQPDALGSLQFGIGKAMWLQQTPLARAGAALPIKEITAGAVPTAGTIDVTNRSYTPNQAQDGSKDFAVFYELDGTATPDA